MHVQLNCPDLKALSSFVRSHPDAVAAHDPAWVSILRDGMRQRPATLTAHRDGQVIGWLPMVETHSWLFGRHLVSLPYVNEAGVLADEPRTAHALLERARQLGRDRGVRYIEMRHRDPTIGPGLTPVRRDKKRMTRPLPDSTDALWTDLKAKVRNQVRKGEKAGLTVHFGGEALLDAFYRVFAVNMRDLGTPVFPKRLFAAMLHHLPGTAELCIVAHQHRPVAGTVLIHSGATTEVPSASALRESNSMCANMLMYRELLNRAIARGASVFDFGRSSEDSGTYRFKRQWGAEAHDTGWQHVDLAPSGAAPITKEDDRFGRAIEVWKRLPVWLTRLAGPPIVRGIP